MSAEGRSAGADGRSWIWKGDAHLMAGDRQRLPGGRRGHARQGAQALEQARDEKDLFVA